MRYSLLLLVLIAGCATQSGSSSRIHDAGKFTFVLPPECRQSSLRGVDTYISMFRSPDMTVIFDCSAHSGKPLDSFIGRNQYASHTEQVSGHPVQIASFDMDQPDSHGFSHFIAASFTDAGLTIMVSCKSTENYGSATQIFRSVTFK